MNYILAFDVGTTRTKAVLTATDGSVVASAAETYPIYYPEPDFAEQDPADWWNAIGKTSRELMAGGAVLASRIAGLAFSTQMLNVICLDGKGNPLGRSISWLDCRAHQEAESIMRRLGGPKIFASLLGTAITGKDVLPKIWWLKRHAPELYAGAASFADASGYLLYRATGRLVFEWSCASVTGLFNLKSKKWDGVVMRLLGIDPAKYPVLVGSSEKVGGLTAEAARHLGLLEGTPVFGGAGDAMSAAVGSGAVGEGDGHLCLGTSGFVGLVTQKRVTGRRGMASVQSADPEKLLLVGETETAGSCLKWAAREFYGASEDDPAIYRRMDEDVASTAPGSGRLIFTPWMYGERSPVSDESLRAGFFNLSAGHTRAQMTRAIYEGVAFNLRWILDSMDEMYKFHPDPLRVIGGGANGAPWLQIVADVTGRRLERMSNPQESGAIGAAMLAAVGLGIQPSVESIKSVLRPAAIIEPHPAPRKIYDDLYAAFREIYPALKGLYHKLNRIN